MTISKLHSIIKAWRDGAITNFEMQNQFFNQDFNGEGDLAELPWQDDELFEIIVDSADSLPFIDEEWKTLKIYRIGGHGPWPEKTDEENKNDFRLAVERFRAFAKTIVECDHLDCEKQPVEKVIYSPPGKEDYVRNWCERHKSFENRLADQGSRQNAFSRASKGEINHEN